MQGIFYLLASIRTVFYLDRHALEKLQRSQYRPSLITPPRFARAVASKPVNRWNFRKAMWSHCIALTNKLARTLPPPDSPDMNQAYQCFCNVISIAAKKCIPRDRRNNRIPCWDAECETSIKHSCNTLKGMTLAELLQLCQA